MQSIYTNSLNANSKGMDRICIANKHAMDSLIPTLHPQNETRSYREMLRTQ